ATQRAAPLHPSSRTAPPPRTQAPPPVIEKLLFVVNTNVLVYAADAEFTRFPFLEVVDPLAA
ncbi:MAG: hypothetical protein QME96_12665, partial [Myxococcota bacterium]|nr:hypothetical protein [Myxococcota bacterium]